MSVSDIKIYAGAIDGWVSIRGATGPAGPTEVSAELGNTTRLGTDGKIYTPATTIPIGSTTVRGTVQLADAAAVTAGTATRVVDAAQLKAVRDAVPTAADAAGVALAATGAIGTSPQFAREDHTHPRPTLAELGAAAASHTHTAGQVTGLATVATTGSYNDLTNKPTIPTAYTLPVATTTVLGGVKQGTNITIAADGTISSSGGGLTQADADARYVNVAGDWMSGPLALGGGSAFTTTAPLDINANTMRLRQNNTPASQTAPGEAGMICWDAAFLYLCVAQNQWRRLPWLDWAGTFTSGTWAPATPSGPPLGAIAFNGGLFTAENSRWSVDGATWQQGTGRPGGAVSTTRAVFGNGTWVTVQRSASGVVQPPAYSSADGKAWTVRPMGAALTSGTYRAGGRCLAFGNGLFVTLPYNSSATTLVPRTSTNGTAWTNQAAAPAGVTDIAGIAWGAGRFVAVGSNNSAAVSIGLTSTNGSTWTTFNLPLTLAWKDILFANGRFIAIGTGNVAVTSTDGVTWSQVTLPTSADWECLEFGGNRWMMVAPNTSTALTSVDGLNWTTVAMPSALAWNGLASNGTVWVATSNTATLATFTPNPAAVTYFPIVVSRSLVVSDAGATIANQSTGAAPVTVTIPNDTALPLPVGTEIKVIDASATAVTTIRSAADVALNWNGRLVGGNSGDIVDGGFGREVQIPGPLSQVVLRKVGANFWTILY